MSSCKPARTCYVLLQPEMEKRRRRVMIILGRSFSHAKAARELYARREGGHPPAAPDRPRARLRPLRRAPALAHALLPLAEAVLRERPRRLRAQGHDPRRPPPPHHRRAARQAPAQERGGR